MSEYRYSKWSDGNKRFKSKRDAGKKMEQLICQIILNGLLLEKKRVPGLVDFDAIHSEPSNKRSRVNERISNRYMVIQTSINPFLSTTDYIGDLKVQDTMLRPKDSNINEA